jgi:eukaryotic-like serine/threonine-protein kinase
MGKGLSARLQANGLLSGIIYPVQGRYDLVIEKARESIKIDPDFVFGYNILALGDIAIGDLDGAERALDEASARKLEIPDLFVDRYQIAFLKNDQKEMGLVASQTPRESGAEDWMAHLQSTAFAYNGHLKRATEMSERAVSLARNRGLSDRAGLFRSAEAIRYAFFEDKTAAVRSAQTALELSRGAEVEYGAAIALVQAGELSQARLLVEDMEKRFPENTAVEFIYVPEIFALIALQQHEPAKAIEILQTTVAYEQGQLPSASFGFYGMFYPAYLRGQAFLAERQGSAAAAEFQKILEHRGVVISDPIGALAHLQLGRAFAQSGDKARAKASYEDFFKIWKGSDTDIPILMHARVDYGYLE